MNAKINVKSLIIVIGVVLTVPSGIVAYQSIERPWPRKERVEKIELIVKRLDYRQVQQDYWACIRELKLQPNNNFIKKQCKQLEDQLKRMKR